MFKNLDSLFKGCLLTESAGRPRQCSELQYEVCCLTPALEQIFPRTNDLSYLATTPITTKNYYAVFPLRGQSTRLCFYGSTLVACITLGKLSYLVQAYLRIGAGLFIAGIPKHMSLGRAAFVGCIVNNTDPSQLQRFPVLPQGNKRV